MFPLEDRPNIKLGYKFGQPTTYSSKHLGTDYIVANGSRVYAPFDGTVTAFDGPELGKTILFRPNHLNVVIRMGHLQQVLKTGVVSAGDIIALSDHSGSLAGDVPHVHMDISKGATLQLNNFPNFIDPQKFNWDEAPNIPLLFQEIWHRPAAKGEINYFSKRLLNGSITNEADLKVKMAYWYSIVYPHAKLSISGNIRWQIEKLKYL